MAAAIIIPVSFFALVFALMYVYWATRNKERMAMIEKGVDIQQFKTKVNVPKTSYLTLKLGLFFIGIALGILLGNMLDMWTTLTDVSAYMSMIILFGGLGLVAGHFVQSRKENK